MSLSTNKSGVRDEPESDLPEAVADTLPPEPAPPERIGRYVLRFELASGGMGSVYLARLAGAQGFEKLVALKRIHPHLAKDKACVEMFLDEAKIASRITHPNVCSVFDFGEADGEYFLAMEYLVGEPLSRLYTRVAKDQDKRRDPLLPLRMARIIADACEGLHAAHQLKDAHGDLLNVVHRDVNPRNLFVTYDGAVQVVDFGLASARERLHKTETGDVKGTMAYMAPEQLRTGTTDRRIDVWGLGAALWEGLAVRRLFKRDTTANTMYALLHDEILPPSEYRPQVPKELDDIVLKALARDPNERWRSAREMGQALRKFLADQEALIGPPELSDWMTELFPQGEARKTQLMELARMAHAPVLSIPATGEFDVTQTAMGSGLVPNLPKRQKRQGLRIALAATALVIAAALGLFFARGEGSVEKASVLTTMTNAEAVPVDAVERAAVQAADGQPAPQKMEPSIELEAQPAVSAEPEHEPQAEAAKPRAKQRARPIPRKALKPGTINLVTRGGWAEVFKDGRSLGTTPVRLTLPPGRHRLSLKPSGNGAPKRITVDVEAGKTKPVSVNLN